MSHPNDVPPASPPQPELDFRGAASKARKRRKQLKRSVARARRVEKEGLRPRAVECPHCGAPAFGTIRRDPGDCRTYHRREGGWRSLPGGRYHKARIEAAARRKELIIREGERAGEELRSADA